MTFRNVRRNCESTDFLVMNLNIQVHLLYVLPKIDYFESLLVSRSVKYPLKPKKLAYSAEDIFRTRDALVNNFLKFDLTQCAVLLRYYQSH